MPSKLSTAAAALLTLIVAASPGQAQITRMSRNPAALILEAANVKAGTDMLFVSGQLAAQLDPKKPAAEATSIEDYGDTKTQTISCLTKIKEILAVQGYAMSDLVKLTLYVAADPKTGKLDFAGVNAGFQMFFKTAENPETVTRSTFQVAALVAPQFLIEIDAIAAKKGN